MVRCPLCSMPVDDMERDAVQQHPDVDMAEALGPRAARKRDLDVEERQAGDLRAAAGGPATARGQYGMDRPEVREVSPEAARTREEIPREVRRPEAYREGGKRRGEVRDAEPLGSAGEGEK